VSSLRAFIEMTDADRASGARRLLDDPLAMGILSVLEHDAVNAMIEAETDQGRREARDTVRTVRAFRQALVQQVKLAQEAMRVPRVV